MDPAAVRKSLIAVLERIQADSGQPSTTISGSTCPTTDLPGFDSKLLPVAIVMLGEAIGTAIPADKNLFAKVNGNDPTVDQIVERVCALTKSQASVA
jgi:hypothetical protein